MAGNTWGRLFRVTTAGVSHGPGYLCIVDGCPAGMELSVEDLLPDLRRRKPGQSILTTQRQEEDAPEIISGIHNGKPMVRLSELFSEIMTKEPLIMPTTQMPTGLVMQILPSMQNTDFVIPEEAAEVVLERPSAG
jgi:Chorismate synthase